ncbi:MAG: PadR family transcriptional regulator [Gemmatimonadaceae bacterium]
MEFIDNWETQARRGLLELCILNVIARERMYGYDIVRALSEAGTLDAAEGTVYPLLARLRREGIIEGTIEESDRGPARKYYRLTARGSSTLRRMNALWTAISESVDLSRGGRRR